MDAEGKNKSDKQPPKIFYFFSTSKNFEGMTYKDTQPRGRLGLPPWGGSDIR